MRQCFTQDRQQPVPLSTLGSGPQDYREPLTQHCHTYSSSTRKQMSTQQAADQTIDPNNDLATISTNLYRHASGRIGYTGPTGRTGPSPNPSDPTAYCTHTSLAQLLASSSLLVEVNPSF